MEWEDEMTKDYELWKEIQGKKFYFKKWGQMKSKLFIEGAFSSVSLTAQMNAFFDENPNIKIEAINYKVIQRVVDCVPLNDRECLLIYREGNE